MPPTAVDILDYELDLEQEVRTTAQLLRDGELVVLPTETVYGIGARPNVAGVREKLASLRGDAPAAPWTPHLPDADAGSGYLGEVSAVGRRLMRKLWPGPVALVFEVPAARRREVAAALGLEEQELYNEHGQVVLRCPHEPMTQSILRSAGQPVVLTRVGLPRGLEASRPPDEHEVPEGVARVLDAGPTRFSKPSTVIRVSDEFSDRGGWEVIRAGVFDRRMVERMLRTTVLFVCSGNTCRSPMAMALARKLLAEQIGVEQAQLADSGYEVISAGTFAMPGMRATPAAAEAMTQMGTDLSSHRSQPLSVELIHRADAIITMGQSHQQAVTGLLPSAAGKTLCLDPEGDIEDPIGSDAAHYRELATRLEQLVRARLTAVLQQE